MTTITVMPQALVGAAEQTGRACGAAQTVPGDLAAAAEGAAICGDAEVAAALGEFVAAWGRALPSLLDGVTQLAAALTGAAHIYTAADTAAAGHDH